MNPNRCTHCGVKGHVKKACPLLAERVPVVRYIDDVTPELEDGEAGHVGIGSARDMWATEGGLLE